MKLTSISLVYKITAVFSFITLISLLVYLTYNTFILNDQQYQNTEKLLIKEFYYNAIRNDKLYPGGQDIFDANINPKLALLDSLDKHHSSELRDTISAILQIWTGSLSSTTPWIVYLSRSNRLFNWEMSGNMHYC
ncbi:hypothetical protein [Sphingobacterium populi]|uniref:hypothetical protein n=1 Tax=Sphingobacterium sp. CFCC 11742 TaxID=1775560 RepID=UPI0012E7DA77|nr:hypothetical protein [Sphingobacterium sp. CFCC 11742]